MDDTAAEAAKVTSVVTVVEVTWWKRQSLRRVTRQLVHDPPASLHPSSSGLPGRRKTSQEKKPMDLGLDDYIVGDLP